MVAGSNPVRLNHKMKQELNISQHRFGAKHTIMTSKDAEELLQRYNLSKKQLPKILKNDAAIKELNANRGDIIEIVRKSHTTGESIFYRLVI